MKRSRVISCCAGGKQVPPAPPRPVPASQHFNKQRLSTTAENRGAHNKNADCNGAPVAALLKLEQCDSERPRDVAGGRDLTSVGMKAGAGGSLSSAADTARPLHSLALTTADMLATSSDKTISKKDKARQKFSNSLLKRAKVLISDRASQSSPYRVSATPPLNPDKFKVLKLRAAIDKKPTTIDERSTAVLKYRTPHFRAVASVEVPPLRENQGVLIGWIQACTEMRFINSYGKHGVTSWEFPEIMSGKYTMIGDADGKQYPWYGSKLELQAVYGPMATSTCTTVHMNDNFFPQVTWYVPHPDYDKTPRLTHIHRKQKFYTFLVAKDVQHSQYHVLKTIEWRMELNVSVQPGAPLGKRATLCEPLEQTQPCVLQDNSIRLEPYALHPPNANNAQTLIWRPRDGEPRMIVPPVETSIDMQRYLAATRHLNIEQCSSGGAVLGYSSSVGGSGAGGGGAGSAAHQQQLV